MSDKVWIKADDDEFYPWFSVEATEEEPSSSGRPFDERIEVDRSTLERWQHAIQEAKRVQREIYDAVKWGGG